MVKKKALIIVLIIIAVLSVTAFTTIKVVEYENQRGFYAQEAMDFGAKALVDECLKEGKPNGICQNLEISRTETECMGQSCWIVYGMNRRGGYDASVVVSKIYGKYSHDNYLRNSGIQ